MSKLRPWRSAPFRVGILAALLLLLGSLTVFSIWRDHRDRLQAAEHNSQSLAHTLDEHIARTFLSIDQTLRFLQAAYEIDPARFDLLEGSFATIARHQALHQISVIDRHGRVGTTTAGAAIDAGDLSGRDYFRVHAAAQTGALHISAPSRAPVSGRWSIHLARRLNQANGMFDGVIVASLDPAFFTRFFQSISMGLAGRFMIVRNDGLIMASEPFMESAMGHDLSHTQMLIDMVPEAAIGTYVSDDGPDRQRRVISYRMLADLPLIVALGVSEDEALAPWRSASLLKAGVAAAVAILACLLVSSLGREVGRMKVTRRLQRALDSFSEGLALWDTAGRLVLCNARYLELYAFTVRPLTPGVGYVDHLRAEIEARLGGAPGASVESELHRRLSPVHNLVEPREPELVNGRWIQAVDRPTEDGGTVSLRIDVTERKQIEAQLLQAQKMDALGQLAGGVAHDFNNLLSVIGGYASLALRRTADEPSALATAEIRDCLSHIVKGVRRAATLTREMLVFGRKQMLDAKTVDLNRLVRDQEFLLRPLLGEAVTLDIVPFDRPLYVRLDPNVMAQAVVNLAINARDAMPNGGPLRLELRALDPVDPHFPASLPHRPHIRLTVADQGIGMDEATRRRIFEPFFTTKPVGSGTGLGLSMVYGAIKQAGGRIDVQSALGGGTTFVIDLPAAEPPVAAPYAEIEQADGGSRTGRILVAEDESDLRTLIVRILEECGHAVTAVTNGVEALRAIEDQEFDLLLTDLVMPELGGLKLATLVGEAYPQLRVVFMTGYPSRGRYLTGEIPAGATVLFKPVDPEILLRAVDEALRGAAPVPPPAGVRDALSPHRSHEAVNQIPAGY